MAAGKLNVNLTVFLDSVDAERYTQTLLHHGVSTLDDLTTLTQDKLNGWDIYSSIGLPRAITKAQRLVRSSDAVVQEELLVSDTKRKTEVCLSVLVRLKVLRGKLNL